MNYLYINYKELYDEQGAKALINHCFSNSGEAYELLTQKLAAEVDLLYVHSTSTDLPFIENTLDGVLLSIFDSSEDAEMTLQEFLLQGYNVELRNFMDLTELSIDTEAGRKGIFVSLFNLGISSVRINAMLTIPLFHITKMPDSEGFVSVDKEVTNPTLWLKYLIYLQTLDIKEDITEELMSFLTELINVYTCAPLMMNGVKAGESVGLENFTAMTLLVKDNFEIERESLLLFPDNNSLSRCFKDESFKDLKSQLTSKMQLIHPFYEMLEMVDEKMNICIYFTPYLRFILTSDDIEEILNSVDGSTAHYPKG